MEFKGEFDVNANRRDVFAFFSDIDRIVSIIPDVKSAEKINENSSRLVVKAGLSGIKGKFNVVLQIKNATNDEIVEVEAKGSGSTGSINLNANYSLLDSGNGGTIVKWILNITLGGMIATMGSRVVNNTAEKYTKELTESFKKTFEK